MSLKDRLESANFSDLIDKTVLVDTMETFIYKTLREGDARNSVSSSSRELSANGEYIFTDGSINEIVIGIDGYITTEQRNQYDRINEITDKWFDAPQNIIGKQIIQNLMNGLTPSVLLDVLIGMPATNHTTVNTVGSIMRNEGSSDELRFEDVDSFRKYCATGDFGNTKEVMDLFIERLDKLSAEQFPEGMEFTIPSPMMKPRTNQTIYREHLDILTYIFGILIKEKCLTDICNDIVKLKTGSGGDISALSRTYVTETATLYSAKLMRWMTQYYPEESRVQNIQSLPDTIKILRSEWNISFPPTSVFKIDANMEPTDSTTKATGEVYFGPDQTRYSYSNEGFGHVLIQTLQFARFMAHSSFISIAPVSVLISEIFVSRSLLNPVFFIQDTGFNIPTKPGTVDSIDFTDYLLSYASASEYTNTIDIMSFLMHAHRVIVEDGAGPMTQSPLYNNYKYTEIRDVFVNKMDSVARDTMRRCLVVFGEACRTDGSWDIYKLQAIQQDTVTWDFVLNGDLDKESDPTTIGGCGALYCMWLASKGLQPNQSIFVTSITHKLEGVALSENSICEFEYMRDRIDYVITGKQGRYAPVVFRDVRKSVIREFVNGVVEIYNDEYISAGSIFTNTAGNLLIELSKPPRYIAQGVFSCFDAAVRPLAIAVPPLIMAAVVPAALGHYLYRIAVYNPVSEHPALGIGQAAAIPIIALIQCIGQLIQYIGMEIESTMDPIITRYGEVPVRILWTQIIRQLSKNVLDRDDDLIGISYPTSVTYIKRIDRMKRAGTNSFLDGGDSDLISQLIMNEYLYDTVWNDLRTEWYDHNTVIAIKVREFIDSDEVSDGLRGFFETYFFTESRVGRDSVLAQGSNTILFGDIFSSNNKSVLFGDYESFIGISRNTDSINIVISTEPKDLAAYQSAFSSRYPDCPIDILEKVRSINARMYSSTQGIEGMVPRVVNSIPAHLIEDRLPGSESFVVKAYTILSDTIGQVERLTEELLSNINKI
jgi:hypothetical protein